MLNKYISKFSNDVCGVAATEFALVVPVLLLFLAGVIEYSHAITVTRRAEYAAHFFSEFLTRDPDNILTEGERIQAQESWGIINPHLNKPDDNPFAGGARTHAYGYAAITFEKVDEACDSSDNFDDCPVEPDVHWTFYGGSYRGIEGTRVSCDLQVVANGSQLAGNNIHRSMQGRSAAIMSTVKYRFESLLMGAFISDYEREIILTRRTRSGRSLEFPSNRLRTTGHIQDC